MKSKLLVFIKRYLFAAVASLYAFTLGVFTGHGRHLILKVCEHFGTAPKFVDPQVPAASVRDVIGEGARVQLAEATWQNGNTSLLELLVLTNLAAANEVRSILEIGTFDGRTTLNLAVNSPEQARVVTLDLPAADQGKTALDVERDDLSYIDKEESGTRFKGTAVAEKITQLYGDSATFDFSEFEGAVDLMFVDGSHAYDYVRNDTEVAFRSVRADGGVIVWHDYDTTWPGVTRALNECYAGDPRCRDMVHVEGTSLVILRRSPEPARGHG